LTDVCTIPSVLLVPVMNLCDRKIENKCMEFNESVEYDFN